MASKHKRRPERPVAVSNIPLRQIVDRLIAQERYKEAVKQAKICHKQEPTAEHHHLLEHAYLLRATQLLQGGMSNAAHEVAHHLMEFGITDPTLKEPAATLFVKVGMTAHAFALQGNVDTPEARERLTRIAADTAVTGSGPTATLPVELREGAQKVRRALEAIQVGDEPKALAELQEIARNSPFADWRLFVRGWAAFRRRQDTEARANWDRLDPARAAAKIAGTLLVVTGSDRIDQATVENLDKLEKWAIGASVIKPLSELDSRVTKGQWPEAFALLRTLRPVLSRIDVALAERLTQSLYFPLIRTSVDLESYIDAEHMIQTFTRSAEPLPIDPRWNRLWAIVWEGPNGHIEEAEPFWRKYLEDLKTTPALRPEQRDLAQAMVLTRLGKGLLEYAEELAPRSGKKPDDECKEVRQNIIDCLEESVRIAPDYLEAYKNLLAAHMEWRAPVKAAEVARKLLKVAPNDFETLRMLASHHSTRNEAKETLEYAVRARELRPLDFEAVITEWYARTDAARFHAMAGNYDQARTEIAIAERLSSENSCGVQFAASKVMVELKAKQASAAETIIHDTVEKFAEPTPFWLALTIESIRYKMPKADQERFKTLLLNDIVKKAHGETAGRMSRLMYNVLAHKIKYTGQKEHNKLVVDYLKRTPRIKFESADDLASVCGFLDAVKGQKTLQESLVKRGVKLFPDDPEFVLQLSIIELKQGPFGGKLTIIQNRLKKTLGLVETGNIRAGLNQTQLIKQIKEMLSKIDEIKESPVGFHFQGPGGRKMSSDDLMKAFMAMMGNRGFDLDEEDDDDDDDDF